MLPCFKKSTVHDPRSTMKKSEFFMQIESVVCGLWSMDKKKLFFFLFLLCSLHIFSSTPNTPYNPYFRDSVLKNKVDSAAWNQVIQKVDPNKAYGKTQLIQQQKKPAKSKVFFFISAAIVVLLLVLRLLFDDFSFSLLEGIISVKKFFIFYKSKKYDSFLAVIFIYALKIAILSLITYIVLQHLLKSDFTAFNFRFFADILFLLALFFTLKNILEFIFNRVINTDETFKAFFLQNLFAEFLLSIFLLFLLLIYLYNDHISYHFMAFIFSLGFAGYIIFNVIRSYQLMSNVRIPYKLHFFLYICAFKIIPILLLAKYILGKVG
ncbi:MAG: hypothetical protein JWN78_1676 [Bacteroidota bacterium]|nr:hypothetical protein [Bacteroidota bacterium]